jgi:E3 ubiquitin-protein ligase RGLG
LSGPTSFAPIVNKAIEIARTQPKKYHILIIITDGDVSEEDEAETAKSIREASEHPLSIIMVGVGDGPWNRIRTYDDRVMDRRFDNFQFVDYQSCMKNLKNPEITFALNALRQIPKQYELIKKFGYLN